MRLIDYFDLGYERYPQRPCLIDEEGALTYAEVFQLTHQVANGLLAAGLTKESKYAALGPNGVDLYVACLGGLRIGAKWTSLAAGNALEESIERMRLNECECLFFHVEFAAVVERIARSVATLRLLVCVGGIAEPYPSFRAWAKRYPDTAPPLVMREDEVAFHAGSGGSSGFPKSVMLTNANAAALFEGMLGLLPHDVPPVHLIVVPVAYAQGMASLWLLSLGATTVLLRHADPLTILRAIESYHVTTVTLPPTLIYRILNHPQVRKFDYSSLRYVHYAMAPISPEKLERALDVFGPVMIQTYGQAEAPTVMTCLTPADHVNAMRDPTHRGRLRSCGRSSPVCRIGIMDERGELLEPGQVGEIVCRGPLVMKGYYKDPQGTAATQVSGWHHTGDLGHLDGEGYLYIDGRKKDMIISGGFNVYPAEVERVLGSHPAVRECVVLGIPHADWGEQVIGVVERELGQDVDEASLMQYCREHLGSVKAPKAIVICSQLPRNDIGKVLRHEVRHQMLQQVQSPQPQRER